MKRLNICDHACAPSHALGMDHEIYHDNDGWATTAPVGSFPAGASPFGALDMAGNVAEWTADAYARYSADASVNPTGPEESGLDGRAPGGRDLPSAGWRVIRGGDWGSNHPSWVRGRARTSTMATSRLTTLGFRCARAQ